MKDKRIPKNSMVEIVLINEILKGLYKMRRSLFFLIIF